MKELKETSGTYYNIFRSSGGVYGIETVTLEKGKVKSVEQSEPTFPTIVLSKLGKQMFVEAQNSFDASQAAVSPQ